MCLSPCRNGGCQAGTFCALSTLHQELIHEEAVDIYKTVKLYAAKRPNVIPSKVRPLRYRAPICVAPQQYHTSMTSLL